MHQQIDIPALLDGDRNALSRAITFIESNRPGDRESKWALLEQLLPHTGKSKRVAISGAPGVGKSSFIDRLGAYLIASGHRVGVLAIDPSSSNSGGSILGDRTRMTSLSAHSNAFIRPSPATDTLGGIAARSKEVMLLMEAAGYDIILIETVGVGQSEVAARYMVDYFMLLLLPGAGDDLQGIKRGIMEMADLLIVHKSDGDQLPLAQRTAQHFKAAMHLFPPKPSGVPVEVARVSSLQNKGIEEVWQRVMKYVDTTEKNGYFQRWRRSQEMHWLEEGSMQILLDYFKNSPELQSRLNALKSQILSGDTNPVAALHTIDHFIKKLLHD